MFSNLPRRDHTDERPAPATSEKLPVLEGVLHHWIRSRERPDIVQIEPDGGSTLHLDQVLSWLLGSPAPLDPACARRLGLPDDGTVADAAHDLLFARHHPDGPRCRSFRSASYYLYGLARIVSAVDQPERSSRPPRLRATIEPSTWISGATSDGRQPDLDPSPKDHIEVREWAGR